MTPMKASARSHVHRRLFGLMASGAAWLALAIGGCGSSSSETPQELTPEAKKALATAKGADLSKYAPIKGGKRR
jgi:hypothetical protein